MKSLAFLVLSVSSLSGATSTRVEWTIEPDRELTDRIRVPLPYEGESASLLELGYYSSATNTDPFSGDWIPVFSGYIGEKGVNEAGRFELSNTYQDDIDILVTLPSDGTLLSIRFYDAHTVEDSEFYNAVSDLDWGWVTPSDPQSVIDLVIGKETSNLWEGGIPSAFYTSIAVVPEPATCFVDCRNDSIVPRLVRTQEKQH